MTAPPTWNRGLAPAPGVTPPLAGIFDSPASAALVNEQWKPLILSALAQLANNEHLWESHYQYGSNEIAKLIECLIVGDCLEPPPVEDCGGCTLITPDHPAFEFAPSDPYGDNATVLPYAKPAFTLGENSVVPGSQTGDVISTYYNLIGSLNPLDILDHMLTEVMPWALGVPDPSVLFPRFKLRFTGKGKMILTLLAVPQGGIAYITLDGDPIPVVPFTNLQTLKTGDLESWLQALNILGFGLYAAFTGNLIAERPVVIDIETEGDHYLDVTFLPRFSIGNLGEVFQFLEVGWGGGIRRAEFCGESVPFECPDPPPAPPPTLRQNGDCVEWLNPNTGLWECLLTVTSVAAGGCSDCDECEEEDCEDCEDSEECDECA